MVPRSNLLDCHGPFLERSGLLVRAACCSSDPVVLDGDEQAGDCFDGGSLPAAAGTESHRPERVMLILFTKGRRRCRRAVHTR